MSPGNKTILKQVLRAECLPALGITLVNMAADSMASVAEHLRDAGSHLSPGAANLKTNSAMSQRLPKTSNCTVLPPDCAPLLADIKARVQSARLQAGLAANRELLALYWNGNFKATLPPAQSDLAQGITQDPDGTS